MFVSETDFSFRFVFFRYFADYVSLGCELGRKVGRPNFDLPNSVLDLVYGQSVIWYVRYSQ